ncbi:MAG: hypothetical protein ABI761_13400 [Saprospiraceae bacterium]
MNWNIIIVVGVIALALIIFLVNRNLKDEKSFENQLNEDYRKTKDEEDELDSD